jgi:5-methyltetrahydropteroyltriglutamate--homocysteine methyltransferase
MRMRTSTDRILVSHAGTVPRPDALQALYAAGETNRPQFLQQLPSAVREVVVHQARVGIDIVNDGELSKRNFSHYARERLGGIEQPASTPAGVKPRNIVARDAHEFPEFHTRGGGRLSRADTPPPTATGNVNPTILCTAPLTYIGRQGTETDIANLKAALDGLSVEGFLPAVAPGTIEHWLYNEYYKTDEELLFAIADAMH